MVSFTVAEPIDTVAVTGRSNRRLGPEIAVKRLAEAPDGFHARFSAVGRAYEYLVLDAEAPDPFLARVSWHVAQALDVAAMDRAVVALCSASTTSPPSAAGRATARMVRVVRAGRLGAPSHGHADLAVFTIEASSFCHQMVRSIVAILRPDRPATAPPRSRWPPCSPRATGR